MSKPRTWKTEVRDYLIFLVIRTVFMIVQALPLEVAYRIADFFAWAVYHLDKRHRLVADDNLLHAFGDQYTPEERDQLVRDIYRHFCRMVVEVVILPRIFHVRNWKDYLRLVGGDKILDLLLSDRPALIVTGHLGNWEIAGYALGVFGFRTFAIARPLDNPYLDEFLIKFRERTGQRILAKKGDFDELQKILTQGGKIATLGDQDAGARGMFVDFFGRPASTHKAIALLAMSYRVPMVVLGVMKTGEPMQYDVIVEDVIDPEEYEGQPRQITEKFTQALERIIRRFPEQYLWLHRRWKSQPKQRPKRKQAA